MAQELVVDKLVPVSVPGKAAVVEEPVSAVLLGATVLAADPV